MDTYELMMKNGKISPFVVKRKAGPISDQVALLINGKEVRQWKAGALHLKGTEAFQVRDKALTLRWEWSQMTGKPKAFQIFDQERLIASYPADAPAITPRKKWHYTALGFPLASLISVGLIIGIGEQLGLQNNIGLGVLIFLVCAALFTGVGFVLDLIFQRTKSKS